MKNLKRLEMNETAFHIISSEQLNKIIGGATTSTGTKIIIIEDMAGMGYRH